MPELRNTMFCKQNLKLNENYFKLILRKANLMFLETMSCRESAQVDALKQAKFYHQKFPFIAAIQMGVIIHLSL